MFKVQATASAKPDILFHYLLIVQRKFNNMTRFRVKREVFIEVTNAHTTTTTTTCSLVPRWRIGPPHGLSSDPVLRCSTNAHTTNEQTPICFKYAHTQVLTHKNSLNYIIPILTGGQAFFSRK